MSDIQDLFKAIKESDIEAVKTLLQKSPELVRARESGTYMQPLHRAARMDDPNIVRCLIEHGADVRAKTNDWKTPLNIAKSDEVAEVLRKAEANITALFNAIKESDIETVNSLLQESPALVNAKERGMRPIHLAVENDEPKMVRCLLKHGADVHVKKNGRTPLHIVKSVEVAEMLLNAGADINAKSSGGGRFTPLHEARNVAVARFLIEHGANEKAKSIYGVIPFQATEYVVIARFMIDHSIGGDIEWSHGGFHVTEKMFEIVKTLEERGVEIGSSYWGSGPLFRRAIADRNLDFVQYLIEHGADVNACDFYGNSMIHNVIDCKYKQGKILYLAVKHGADVNAHGCMGWTPLHKAAWRGWLQAVRFLCKHGANVNSRDNTGATPLHQAGSIEVMRYLLEQGADANANAARDGTPLHKLFNVLTQGRRKLPIIEAAKLLIDYGADVNHPGGKLADLWGSTLPEMMLAVIQKCEQSPQKDELIKLLKDAGAR